MSDNLFRQIGEALAEAGVPAENMDAAHAAVRAHIWDGAVGPYFTNVAGEPGSLIGDDSPYMTDAAAFIRRHFKAANPSFFAPADTTEKVPATKPNLTQQILAAKAAENTMLPRTTTVPPSSDEIQAGLDRIRRQPWLRAR